MSVLSVSGITGFGQAYINGGAPVTVSEFDLWVTTLSSLAHVDGAAPTRARLHQAGWLGIGFAGGGASDGIYWSRYIDFPARTWMMYPELVFGDSYFWELPDGEVISIEIDY